MKLLILLCVTLFSGVLYAMEPMTSESASLVFGLTKMIAGEHYGVVVMVVLAIGGIWSQLRQLIDPQKLAWLPSFVIMFLEFFAGNLGHSKNEVDKNPINFKRKA